MVIRSVLGCLVLKVVLFGLWWGGGRVGDGLRVGLRGRGGGRVRVPVRLQPVRTFRTGVQRLGVGVGLGLGLGERAGGGVGVQCEFNVFERFELEDTG